MILINMHTLLLSQLHTLLKLFNKFHALNIWTSTNLIHKVEEGVLYICVCYSRHFHQTSAVAEKKTHYERLGVKKNATQTEIKDAFLKISKEVSVAGMESCD